MVGRRDDESRSHAPSCLPAAAVLRLVLTLTLTVVLTVVIAPGAALAQDGRAPVGRLDSYSARAGSDPTRPGETAYYEVFGWAADVDRPGGPVDVHVYVDGAGQAVATGLARPDVGSAVPFAGVSAGWSASVPAGSRVCAYAIDVDGASNTTIGCLTLPTVGDDQAAGGNPVGAFDEVSTAPGLLSVRGWAADDQGGETTLRVVVDGRWVVTTATGGARADVSQVHPRFGGATGWSAELPARPGVAQVCVRALNSGRTGGGHPLLGCRQVTVPGPAVPRQGDVRGRLDEATVGTVGGEVGLLWRGWAFDASAPSVPVKVRFRALASSWRGVGPVSMDTLTGGLRPDVAAAFPAAGPASGYRVESAGGQLTATYSLVCAYAVEVEDTAVERLLGCRSL